MLVSTKNTFLTYGLEDSKLVNVFMVARKQFCKFEGVIGC